MVNVYPDLLGVPQQYTFVRDTDLDLSFMGWVLGENEHGSGPVQAFTGRPLRGVRVTIALTMAGSLVGSVVRFAKDEDDSSTACVVELPEELLKWLCADAGGRLGPASKKAWAQACRYKPLTSYAFEEVP